LAYTHFYTAVRSKLRCGSGRTQITSITVCHY